jgi:hypothetical protein
MKYTFHYYTLIFHVDSYFSFVFFCLRITIKVRTNHLVLDYELLIIGYKRRQFAAIIVLVFTQKASGKKLIVYILTGYPNSANPSNIIVTYKHISYTF